MNNESQEVSKKNKEKRAKWEHPFKSKSAFLDFIGWRHISQKFKTSIDPETGKRKPQTFFIWIISIYVALFAIASQRYENRIDIIENRVNAIFLQLQSPFYKNAFRRIGRVQKMKCPIKPEIWNPVSVILFPFQIDTYSEGVDLLKEAVETWKDSLEGVILSRTDLRRADLRWADLRRAELLWADLSGADLMFAFLIRANLFGADLSGADLAYANLDSAFLIEADLTDADLGGADLTWADLSGADLGGADLMYANLLSTRNLTIEQLLEVKTLYEAKLDSTIVKRFKELHPDRWEELRKY